ncbi:MAG: hypothetical protein QHJ81_16065 [Anaerolineae bacterium]|nr:hypothetical protein [Anaerolineae bacterium]
MKGKWILLRSLVAVAVLTLAAGLSRAQGPEPPGEGSQPQGDVGVQALMGTAFTYQGYLKKGGNPVNGNCDFLFSLWDAETGGNQIGSNVEKTNIPVSNGLFTVRLDFGPGAFQGDARWLRVRVRCPAGSGDYTVLDPRQPLTPAPYALALPGLWTQQNGTSPNIIGGHSSNSVSAGVVGATIGGGGLIGESYTNRVSADYGTVGGGYGNIAAGSGATVGGGIANYASGPYATIGGGRNNAANGYHATVGGGRDNTANGFAAIVGGGVNNTAGGDFATVPGGSGAEASHYGEMAYTSGNFVTEGDAQTSLYVMRIMRTCNAGTWYDLYLNGNDTPVQYLTVAPGRTIAFDALVVGRTQDGESAGYYVRGVVENVGGTVRFIGTPSVTALGEDDTAWDVQAVASDAYDALFIQVKGNGELIRWVATVRTVEVSW